MSTPVGMELINPLLSFIKKAAPAPAAVECVDCGEPDVFKFGQCYRCWQNDTLGDDEMHEPSQAEEEE